MKQYHILVLLASQCHQSISMVPTMLTPKYMILWDLRNKLEVGAKRLIQFYTCSQMYMYVTSVQALPPSAQ